MIDLMKDVGAFHRVCDVPIVHQPAIPSEDRKKLRIELIREECLRELLPAMEADDILAIADAMADTIYVIVGAALEYGIPLNRVWHFVQKANMAKVDPRTNKVLKREDGKVLKPEGWQPPDIEAALRDNTPTAEVRN